MLWITQQVASMNWVDRQVVRPAVAEIAKQSATILRIMETLARNAQRDATGCAQQAHRDQQRHGDRKQFSGS